MGEACSDPYIWPGTLPDQDLEDMGRALPGWHHDSAWIYYHHWDPDIPRAVERFNHTNRQYRAQYQARGDHWVIAVLDRHRADHVLLLMWMSLANPP
jgi:hypothetical protein